MAQKIPSSSIDSNINFWHLHNHFNIGVDKDFPISKELDKEIRDFWQAYKEKHYGDAPNTPPK